MQKFPTLDLFSGFDPNYKFCLGSSTVSDSWTEEFKSIFQDAVSTGSQGQSGWSVVQDWNKHGRQTMNRQNDHCLHHEPITREEFAAVRQVLDKNGYPPEKITELEKKLESKGLTWGELKAELGMSDEFENFRLMVISEMHAGKDQFYLQQNMSKEDFQAIKKVLQEHGVSSSQIESLEKMVLENGLSWEQLIARLDLGPLSRNAAVGDNDKTKIMGFLGALGFNPTQSLELLTKLEEGKHFQAWSRIEAKLENMPSERMIALSREQLDSLFRLMGIDPARLGRFNGFVGRDLGGTELNNFLAMLKKEAMEARTNSIINHLVQSSAKGQAAAGVDPLLAEILRVAQKEASGKDPSQRTRELAFLKGRLENSPKGLGSLSQEGSRVQDARKADIEPDSLNERQNQGNSKKGQSLFDRLNDKTHAGSEVKLEEPSLARGREDPWEKFLSRIRTLESAEIRNAVWGEARSRMATDSNLQRTHAQHSAFVSRQILDQLQNGILRNLGNGRSQLTLQLDPPSLGRVAVVLQIQDKEVRALIRPSSPEVAKMISDNLARFKSSLEQQGLRVARIEVQAQTQGGQGHNWQGQEEHNRARQRMRQAIKIARMRCLEDAGQSGSGEKSAASLIIPGTEGSGLDIFA